MASTQPLAGATRPDAMSGRLLARVLESRVALVVVVATGVVARAIQYLAGSSLSGDEAFLALNLVSRSYSGLFEQLAYNQVAPQLLLVVEKAGLDVFGNAEWSVRLVPFAAGTAALLLFPMLAQELLPARAVLLAVALFAVSDPLIDWTSSNKQYAVDALATVVLLLAAIRLRRRFAEPVVAVWLSALGGIAVWFSFPSVFVLAGFGMALFIEQLRSRRARPLLVLTAVGSTWIASVSLAYLVARQGVTALQESLDGDSGVYIDPTSGSQAISAPLSGAARYLTGIPVVYERGERDLAELVVVVALVFALAGLVAIVRNARFTGAVLGLPIALALVAAAVNLYPLLPRAALWALPILVLLTARGMVAGIAARRPALRMVAGLAAVVVVALTAAPTVGHLFDRRGTQEMRPLVQQLAREVQSTDRVYVYYRSQHGLRWYLQCDCAGRAVLEARRDGRLPLVPVRGGPSQWAPALASTPPRFVVGEEGDGSSEEDARQLTALPPYPRVWVVISNVSNRRRGKLLRALDARGTRLRTISGDGDEGVAAAYLYMLRRTAS